MPKLAYRSQNPKRRKAVADMRRIVSRVYAESGVTQKDMMKVLELKSYSSFQARYIEADVYEPAAIHLSDILLLGRNPETTELARRLLLELLAGLDDENMRVTDMRRLASSPFQDQRERIIQILKPIAEELGLTPHFTLSTAEVTSA